MTGPAQRGDIPIITNGDTDVTPPRDMLVQTIARRPKSESVCHLHLDGVQNALHARGRVSSSMLCLDTLITLS